MGVLPWWLSGNYYVYVLSCFQLFVTPWTVARQASLSMGFPRQDYWSGLPFPFPGDLPNPGIKPVSPALQVDSLPLRHQKAQQCYCNYFLKMVTLG